MRVYELSDAEKYIMEQFWQFGTLSSADVTLHVTSKGWNRSTLYTFLKRLTAKGMIRAEKNDKTNVYVTLITKETYQAALGHQFLNELYGGDAKDFLAAMVSSKYLSDDDIKELQNWFAEQGGKIDE